MCQEGLFDSTEPTENFIACVALLMGRIESTVLIDKNLFALCQLRCDFRCVIPLNIIPFPDQHNQRASIRKDWMETTDAYLRMLPSPPCFERSALMTMAFRRRRG